MTGKLAGHSVLVVEDEAMIAIMLEDMLTDLGCDVVGPAHDIARALELAVGSIGIDVALLDMNLAGRPVFDVADALIARGVPVIFATGYGDTALRETDKGAPVLRKPFRSGDLTVALHKALGIPA